MGSKIPFGGVSVEKVVQVLSLLAGMAERMDLKVSRLRSSLHKNLRRVI